MALARSIYYQIVEDVPRGFLGLFPIRVCRVCKVVPHQDFVNPRCGRFAIGICKERTNDQIEVNHRERLLELVRDQPLKVRTPYVLPLLGEAATRGILASPESR
jgi:hypothetical protein